MQADYEKELCFFVGGSGSKAGVERAGGCTKAWLAAQNGDPSALFGSDGGCLYVNAAIQIGVNRRITGAVGTFAGVQAGMVAWIDANMFSSGYYEVTSVGTQFEYIEFGGADEVFTPETIGVIVGGAFDCLHSAFFRTGAYFYDCHILTNKNETLTETLLQAYSGGNPTNSTFMNVIGYGSSVFVESDKIVSDMDAGKSLHQSNYDVLQNGILTGKKVIIDGSVLLAGVVNVQVDNIVFENFHVKTNAGYTGISASAGSYPKYYGIMLDNCILEGGLNGIKANDAGDCIVCRSCIAVNASGYGFNLLSTNNAAKSAVIENCIAQSCGTGFAVSGGGIVQACLAADCTGAIETNGTIQVKQSVLYNCLEAAFLCNALTARWEIFDTIAVLNENAGGVFQVGPNGGVVVYEDYNCFIDRLGNPAVLHDQSNWPEYDYHPAGIGMHTLQTDPLFVSVAGKDFQLQDSSPCVNAGRPLLYGIKTHIGFYEPAESVPDDEGGNNVQSRRNKQYGPQNKQYS